MSVSGKRERPRCYGMRRFIESPSIARLTAHYGGLRRDGRRCRFRHVYAGSLSHRRLHLNGFDPFIETAPTMGDRLKRVKR
jgi:hypothetical protein